MSVLGIDLGGTNVRVGMVEKDVLMQILSSPINSKGAAEEVLNDIFSLADKLKDANTEGIGIGVPSVVDLKKGIVYDVQNIPSWKEVHLRQLMEERYQVPVYVNNDANCFAVGEKYFGKAKGYNHIVGLIIGTGLGAGIIVNGRLYSGANCGAGEFGMIPYLDDNYEFSCSGSYFGNQGKEFFTRAAEGDQEALECWDMFGEHLGNAIKTILYSIDPEMIVIGGSVSKAYRFFKTEMWKTIGDFAYPNSLKNLVLEVSELENVAVLGAAALFYDAHSL